MIILFNYRALMETCAYRLIFGPGKKTKISEKKLLELVELQSLVEVCRIRKMWSRKVGKFCELLHYDWKLATTLAGRIHRAVFFVFYNNSEPNLAILLILVLFF